jgi:hypothetical protein
MRKVNRSTGGTNSSARSCPHTGALVDRLHHHQTKPKTKAAKAHARAHAKGRGTETGVAGARERSERPLGPRWVQSPLGRTAQTDRGRPRFSGRAGFGCWVVVDPIRCVFGWLRRHHFIRPRFASVAAPGVTRLPDVLHLSMTQSSAQNLLPSSTYETVTVAGCFLCYRVLSSECNVRVVLFR